MKLGRDVSRHNELDNWRNTHSYESVMATIWLSLTISETDPCLWDRLNESELKKDSLCKAEQDSYPGPDPPEQDGMPVPARADRDRNHQRRARRAVRGPVHGRARPGGCGPSGSAPPGIFPGHRTPDTPRRERDTWPQTCQYRTNPQTAGGRRPPERSSET